MFPQERHDGPGILGAGGVLVCCGHSGVRPGPGGAAGYRRSFVIVVLLQCSAAGRCCTLRFSSQTLSVVCFMVAPGSGRVLILVNPEAVSVMTSKDERLAFLEEMKDVRRIRKPNKAEVAVPRELTPGHLARQQAAVETPVRDLNPLTSDMVEPLTAHDVLSWMRPGIQHGVFRKLRLGQYPIDARLDLHRMTVEEARREVFAFINDCVRYGLRSVLILHGKGERNPDGIAQLKRSEERRVGKECRSRWSPCHAKKTCEEE